MKNVLKVVGYLVGAMGVIVVYLLITQAGWEMINETELLTSAETWAVRTLVVALAIWGTTVAWVFIRMLLEDAAEIIAEMISAQIKDRKRVTLPAGATYMVREISAEDRREPVATEEGEWTLWVSEDAGSNYDPEVTVKDPDGLRSRLVQLDEEGLRWYFEDAQGNPHPHLSCRIHRGIIGSMLSYAHA